jgi:hypothetical protein
MLENAVHGVPELRQVKLNAHLHWVQNGTELTFDQYFSLLNSDSVDLDHGLHSKLESSQLSYMNLNYPGTSTYEDDDVYDHDSRDYTHDTYENHEVMAFAARQAPRSSSGKPRYSFLPTNSSPSLA